MESELADKKSLIALGERIREARVLRETSQTELGRLVGKSKQLVSAWEAGRAEITVTTLVRLSKVLGVEPKWLLLGGPTSNSGLVIPDGSIVPCMTGAEIVDWAAGELDMLEINRRVQIYFNASENALAMENPDESMTGETPAAGGYVKNDLLIFDPEKPITPGARVGCVVYADDGKKLPEPIVVFRKIKFLSTKIGEAPYELVPLNTNWATIIIRKANDAKLIGRLAVVQRLDA
jgi:transcriptional regulator with XRE-family HTH domain